jgi:hypothetical protein
MGIIFYCPQNFKKLNSFPAKLNLGFLLKMEFMSQRDLLCKVRKQKIKNYLGKNSDGMGY